MSEDMQTLLTPSADADKHVANIQDSDQGLSTAAGSKPGTKTRVYRVEEIAEILSISLRAAYNLCNTTTEFRVFHIGSSIRVGKESFDAWFARSQQEASYGNCHQTRQLLCRPLHLS